MTLEDSLRSIVREEIRAALREEGAARATPPPAIRPKLLTTVAIAGMCDVTPDTVRNWISSGKLQAKKRNRSFVVEPAELERFLSKAPATDIDDDERLKLILGRRPKEARHG